MNEIEQILTKKKIKPTPVRNLVLKVFVEKNYALSLVDIEAELPWSDKATLFRTLKTFEEKALIHPVNDGGKAQKYALCSDACDIEHHEIHPHFYCEKCHKTLCLTAQNIPIPTLPETYHISSYSLVINGICPDCTT